MAVTVNPLFCPQDHACPAVDACPTGALKQEGVAAPTVDAASCTDCLACVDVCPSGAITEESVEPAR